MKQKVIEICKKGSSGKISVDAFYDSLRAIADDSRTDDDLACLLEDALMDLEMEHDSGSSKSALQKLVKETSEIILEELE